MPSSQMALLKRPTSRRLTVSRTICGGKGEGRVLGGGRGGGGR